MVVAFMSGVVMGVRVRLAVGESIASVYGCCRHARVGTEVERTKDTENPR